MPLELKSPCKINLLLNILGKRPDGFHELETVMHPIPFHDILTFERVASGIHLTCSDATLPTDSKNLVYRAAEKFLGTNNIKEGVRIHLEKRIPHAAGLGGGSGNAATTLIGLNELFKMPSSLELLSEMAASLGSDIPFFLQNRPALATGRGEKIQSLDFFPALKNVFIVLIHPGFGISTPWAYQQFARFPDLLNGKSGRAQKLISLLQTGNLEIAAPEFFNAFETPAFEKYPLLGLIQEFFRDNGAIISMMSGSGSAMFGLIRGQNAAENLLAKFREKFGPTFWTTIAPLS
jgi:4-diphosphocytidyl-2-C-methyl-D-erythritol kinase